MKTLKTTCNRDCPDACSLEVDVDESGRAIRIRGSKEDPVTQGFICERTRRFLDRQYAPDRLTSPLLRGTPIGWDAALDLAAEKLRVAKENHGPSTILHYRSGGSLGMLKHVSEVFFSELGPVTVKRGDICSGAGEEAQVLDFGECESHDLFDILNSRLILLWGKNPHISNVHLLPVLKEAQRRGTIIVGIDPVRTRVAQMADHFLQVKPGADFALAMAIASVLYELEAVDPDAAQYCDNLEAFRGLVFSRRFEDWTKAADLSPAAVRTVAELYASHRPANIQVGWGLGRRKNGARTVRAIDALGAISGNLGVAGGGVSYYFGRRTAFDTTFGRTIRKPPRTFAEARLGAEILAADPPVEVAWVTAGNPVSMLPDADDVRRAFDRIGFTIVVDTHPTDTTDVADLVLPTLTLLEDQDLLGAYGNHWLRASTPVLTTPDGGPRHELHILQGVAARLGIDLGGDVEDWQNRALKKLRAVDVNLDALTRAPVRNPFAAKLLHVERRFATKNGRAQLLDVAPDPPPETSPGFPMTLLAISTPKAQSSQWSVVVPDSPPSVYVHPSAAKGLADGAEAILESAVGRMRVTVRHDDAARSDVARMDKGGMFRDDRCVNRLVEAVETDLGGGAAYYDQAVRIVQC